MTRLFDSFPDELKEKVKDKKLRINRKKKYKKYNKNKLLNSKKQSNYAFEKVKKLPLETKRNVLSAINHFFNVARVSDKERDIAYKKIIKVAESFQICTMGFKEKYYKYKNIKNE